MAARHLEADGILCIYGPFLDSSVQTAPSNLDFDQLLSARDPSMGLRQLDTVNRVATDAGLEPVADHEMPANNRFLFWSRPSVTQLREAVSGRD